jgi:diguanylate cyclase (GGDEF)-like protein/putative nucleotidyltransferase with HDIG domain
VSSDTKTAIRDGLVVEMDAVIKPDDQQAATPAVANAGTDGLGETWSRRQTGVLLRVASALNEVGSLDALMPTIAEAAAEAIGVDRASVYAYDETRTSTVASGLYGEHLITTGDSFVEEMAPADVPAEAEVIRSGRTLYRTRDTAFPNPIPIDDWSSDLVVPLAAGGGTQGVLYVRQAGIERVFSADEIALLEAIGHLAGLAILRAREAEAARRRADHLELLNQLGRALSSTLDLQALCLTIHAEVGSVVASDAFLVALYEEGSDRIWYPYLVDRGQPGPPQWKLLDDGPTSHVIRTRQTLLVRRGNDEIYRRAFHFGAVENQVECALFVPMLRDDRLIGVLSVQRYDLVPYNADEIRTVETIAHQSAAALSQARLFAAVAKARDAAERHAADLRAVLAVSRAIASAGDLETMLATLATETRSLVPHDRLALYRAGDDREELDLILVRGGDSATMPRRTRAEVGAIGRVFLTGEPELIGPKSRVAGMSEGDPGWSDECAALVPLIVGGRIGGVLHLSRDGGRPFSDQEFTIIRILAEHAAVAIRNAELRERNRDLYLAGVRALTSAVDAKDPYTRGHSERVSRLAARLAAALGLDDNTVETVALAGLLHDIGKIGVPDAILQKPGKLDEAEQAVMMRHAELGAEILAGAGTDSLLPLAPLVRHHHEWFNGAGYPDGLAGREIPLGAEAIAVADAFDTMVTDRPYRRRNTPESAVAELRRCAGTQFDPWVVETFVRDVLERDIRPRGTGMLIADGVSMGGDPDETTLGALSEGGRIGDARALGLFVELAGLTRHITDLRLFLARVAEMVRRRLGYEAIYLMLVDQKRSELRLAAMSPFDPVVDTGYSQSIEVGICGRVCRTGRAWNVVDVTKEPSYHHPDHQPPVGSEMVVPFIVDDKVIGVLSAESPRVAAFTAADVTVLTAVADQVAVAIHVAQLHDVAKRAAATDGLTGLANHRAFYDALGEAVERGEPFSLVLFDVEGLKQVNDTAGHLAGDALLRDIAAALREGVRSGDVVARYGGDEFGLIMHGVDRREATRVAARIRRSFLGRPGRRDQVRTTVRFGVAVAPGDGRRPVDLVAMADARMYEMRNAGRGGVAEPGTGSAGLTEISRLKPTAD